MCRLPWCPMGGVGSKDDIDMRRRRKSVRRVTAGRRQTINRMAEIVYDFLPMTGHGDEERRQPEECFEMLMFINWMFRCLLEDTETDGIAEMPS